MKLPVQHVYVLWLFTILWGNSIPVFSQNSLFSIQRSYNTASGLNQDIVENIVQDQDGNILLRNGPAKFIKYNGNSSAAFSLPQKVSFPRIGYVDPGMIVAYGQDPLNNFRLFSFYLNNRTRQFQYFPDSLVAILGNAHSSRALVIDKKFIEDIIDSTWKRYGLLQSNLITNIEQSLHVIDAKLAFLVLDDKLFIINSVSGKIIIKQLTSKKFQVLITARCISVVTPDRKNYMYDEWGNLKDISDPLYAQVSKLVMQYKTNIDYFQDIFNDYLLVDDQLYFLESSKGAEPAYKFCMFLSRDLNVFSLFMNREKKVLYIGTLNKGLLIAFRRHFTLYKFDDSVPGVDNIIYSHTRMQNGDILTRFGIVKLNDTGYTTQIKVIDYNYCRFYRDQWGQLYVPDTNQLQIWDPAFTVKRAVLHLQDAVAYICSGDSGLTCFATFSSVGIIRNSMVIRYKKLNNRYGEVIAIDYSKGNLWAVCDSGLLRFNAGDLNEKEQWVLKTSNRPRFVYADKKGSVWLGISGEGIYKYTSTGKLIKLPLDPQMTLRYANCMFEDRNGYFWIPTNNGLIQVLRADLDRYKTTDWIYYYHYTNKMGLPVNEFNRDVDPSNTESASGSVTFGSMSGVVEFNPQQTEPLLPEYPLRIDSIVYNYKSYFSEEIKLPYNFDRILIYINHPYYGLAENSQVLYMIEGVSDKWTLLNTGEPLIISRLPTGHYAIKIRKLNGFGRGNWSEKRIDIYVRPPWYFTYWAITLWVLLLAVFIWIYINRRLMYLRSQLKLEHLLEEHELKALRAQLNPHFVQNTFDLISLRIRENDPEGSVRIIQVVSKYLRQVLRMSEKPVVSLEDELLFTEDYLQMLQKTLPEDLRYSISIPDELDIYGIQVPSLLLQPILENSIKQGLVGLKGPGEIEVTLSESDRFLYIAIRDNGKGVPAGTNKTGKADSFGLELTKKRLLLVSKKVKKADIRVTIRNRADGHRGAEVLIQIPVAQS
jgi:hypothetical protein